MSDFDREAERERLREKYERDRKEREATERMSELLLQGATMTNAHCSECGDPIFRYDGQEFCATCERPVDREGEADSDQRPSDDAGGVEVTTPSDDSRVVFGGGPGEPGEERSETRTRQRRDDAEQPTADDGVSSPDAAAQSGVESPDRSGGDIKAARASLARTLVAFSQRAEATDDPRQAREHLQAAREAAETLAALR